MKTVLTNMCMIENNQNEVLIQERIKSWKGCAFPGGHVEDNESFVDSVIREIKEETNLDIKDVKLCGLKQYTYKDVRYVVILFKTKAFTGDLKESSEGKVFWHKKNRLKELSLASDFYNMLPLFDDEHSEYFLYEEAGVWKHKIK